MAKSARPKSKPAKRPPDAEESEEDRKRRDWEINNELISEEFYSHVLKYKKFPTYSALAKKLNLNEKTIRRHLAEAEMFDDLKVKLRALKNKALLTLAVKAMKGDNVNWSRLFFEVTEDVKKQEEKVVTIYINGKKATA